MNGDATRDELLRRLKTLSERLWENRCQAPDVEAWLRNFNGRHCGDEQTEHLHALHLLASVSFFGLRELRILLRSMFRDHFRYPIIQRIRDELDGTNDAAEINRRFDAELDATRFMGMGSPAESGTHLLYYFRQENQLKRSLFVNQHELLTSAATDPAVELADPSLRRVVCIDDLCGSADQPLGYSKTLVREIKEVARRSGRNVEFQYLVLFGTTEGLARAQALSDFDVVDAVSDLDSTYRTFGIDSRVFRRPPEGIDHHISQTLATKYGAELWPRWPLGYKGGQLLLAFHHNVPNNSLPILWFDEGTPAWKAAFPRHPKID